MAEALLPINLINEHSVFLKRRQFSSKEIVFQAVKFVRMSMDVNGADVFVEKNEHGELRAKIVWLLDGSTQTVRVKEKDGNLYVEGAKVLPKNWLKQQEDKYAELAKHYNEMAYQYLCIRHNQMS